jgi:hypothetical protein
MHCGFAHRDGCPAPLGLDLSRGRGPDEAGIDGGKLALVTRERRSVEVSEGVRHEGRPLGFADHSTDPEWSLSLVALVVTAGAAKKLRHKKLRHWITLSSQDAGIFLIAWPADSFEPWISACCRTKRCGTSGLSNARNAKSRAFKVERARAPCFHPARRSTPTDRFAGVAFAHVAEVAYASPLSLRHQYAATYNEWHVALPSRRSVRKPTKLSATVKP